MAEEGVEEAAGGEGVAEGARGEGKSVEGAEVNAAAGAAGFFFEEEEDGMRGEGGRGGEVPAFLEGCGPHGMSEFFPSTSAECPAVILVLVY